MQNSLNKEGNIVEFLSKPINEAKKGVSIPNELSKSAFVTPLKASAISVIKKMVQESILITLKSLMP